MKKAFLTVLAVVALSFSLSAQDNVLSKGDSHVNLGVGFGTVNRVVVPPISLSYEYGAIDFDDAGSIGFGGYFGFASYKYGYNRSILAARAAYHYTLIDYHWEVYAGGLLGYGFYNYKDDYQGAYASHLQYSFFLGTRYMFSDSVGAFAELGYGISYFNLGLTFKF